MSLAKAAAWYGRHGFAVFPLRPGTKVPLTPRAAGGRGFLDATTDADRIEKWWRRTPNANIGISCIGSRVAVIDIDPRNGGDDTLAALEREHGRLPATWTVLTAGGGQHYYYRVPDDFDTDVSTLGPGIDLKWRGYVVAPPSVVGRPYGFDLASHPSDTELVPFATPLGHTKKRSAHAPSTDTDAAESFLGAAFESLDWLGDKLPDGRRMAKCPWHAEHTDGRGDGGDTSTVLFPRTECSVLGGFRCSHSHCESRTWRDVLDVLPEEAHAAAKEALRRYGIGQRSIWDEPS